MNIPIEDLKKLYNDAWQNGHDYVANNDVYKITFEEWLEKYLQEDE